MPGYKTPVFGYNGLVPGPDDPDPPRPAHRGPPGQPAAPAAGRAVPERGGARRRTRNDPWQRSTSTHLHGSASLPQFDGYASDVTYPGQVKNYFYPNCQEARTLWYHDHGVHHTSQNAYNGLAGMYVLHDERRGGPGDPDGCEPRSAAYDVPLIVATRCSPTRAA